MVAELRVTIEKDDIKEALERLRISLPSGDMTPTMQALGRALKSGAQLRFRSMTGPDGTQWPKSRRAAGGGQTLSMTRRLRNSITFAATRDSVTVGTNVLYAAIHQFGGIIKAKNGPFLAIPITAEARAAGSPRNMPDLHVMQTLKGQFYLANERGVAQYLLRRQITMPARPYLGLSTSDWTECLRILRAHYDAAWGRGPA